MGMLSTEHSGEPRVLRYVDYERARLKYVTALSHHYWRLRALPGRFARGGLVLAELTVEQELLGQMHLGIPS